MRSHVVRIIAAALLIIMPNVGGTNAYFVDFQALPSATISTGCWTAPTIPVLVTPATLSTFFKDSPWLFTSLFDWEDSSSSCQETGLEYQLQITGNTLNSSVYFLSEWMVDTQFTYDLPDGTYVWKVRSRDSKGNEGDYSQEFAFSIDRSQNEISDPTPTPTPVPTSTPIPTPTPIPLPEIHYGDVIINEIMWMGSTSNGDDEWIELYNLTNNEIDLSGWKLTGARSGNNQDLTILNGKKIAAHGYFLLTKKEPGATSLADSVIIDMTDRNLNFHNSYSNNGPVILKTPDDVIIDQTPISDRWPAGADNTSPKTRKSMERNAYPGSGTNINNWHTCIASGCTSPSFWKDLNNNYGTPRAQNLSEDDMSMNPITTKVDLFVDPQTHVAWFTLSGPGLDNFTSGAYKLFYSANGVVYELDGFLAVSEEPVITSEKIKLGTCSQEVCVYPEPLESVSIEVTLTNSLFNRVIHQEKQF